MWGERIKRIVIITIVALLVAWGGKSLIARPSPLPLVDQFLSDATSKVLGLAVGKLSGAKKTPKEMIPLANESEPINQPVVNIQTQTQQLIESIKKLPEDQIEAVKKQVVKDFCQKFLQE